MIKYVFALASITTLSGAVIAASVAGCGSPDEAPADPTDAGNTDARRPTPTPPVGDDENEATKTCLSDKQIDVTAVPYKPPAIQLGACDDGAIKVIEDLVKTNPKATYADLKTALSKHSETCAKCVFGADGEKWAPIVESGDKVALNRGGCVDIVSGKEGCGKAYQQWDQCLEEACKTCEDGDRQACASDAQKAEAACGTSSEALLKACGNDVNTYIQSCFKPGELIIKGPITKQCIGGGIKDAGSDT
jgi:hypothetical protein